MKTKKLIMILLCQLIICTACGKNKSNEEDNTLKGDDFKEKIEMIETIINELDISNYQNDYNVYTISDDYLSGLNFNTETSKSDFNIQQPLDGYNINHGIIVRKENGDIYFTIESDEYCAVKDFGENEASIYGKEEFQKCRRLYRNSEDINVEIIALSLTDYSVYEDGTVSNDYVSLIASSNIFDSKSYTLKWYRNDVEINDSNVSEYTVTADNEDALYYVELTTYDGKITKSSPIHVIIKKDGSVGE